MHELPNLELENDRVLVVGYLERLGFSPDMVEALNAAERYYKITATPFELKSCFSHLRSFLEHLHRESAKAVAALAGEIIPKDTWGCATVYLRQKDYFTKHHEDFSTSLYTLISDTSVHPLGADRQYARLLRGMVIEYGLMFLSSLESKGVRLGVAPA